MKNTTAVILAAGKGTRMKSGLPKVLHEVGGKPMLERVIANLRSAGVDDIITVVGHGSGAVKKLFDGQTRFVEQKELLGSGHALSRAVDLLPEKGKVLVACGDAPLISPASFGSILEACREEGASCAVLTCEMRDPFSYGRIFRGEKGEVLRIVEEKDLASPEEKAVREVNTGTYCFESSDIKAFVSRIEMNEKKKEFYLTDIVGILRAEGREVAARTCPEEEAIGINTRADLAAANRTLNMDKIKDLMDNGVTIVSPENTYVAEDALIGKDTVIFPGTVIDGGVTVGSGCRIGPMAHLRTGTVIGDRVEIGNFTEINRTRIAEGTRVKHQAYLGDATVGRDVNIGAGTVTANYDGKRKNPTVIEDGAFIGIGARLVAPVKIGKGAVVGAGAVVTRGRDVGAGETVAGIPARPVNGSK
ncbi:MAG: NTP transferase domain-containing protein [Candidatus Omnitrophica bacterium]|nr:NTP transferase domain-containing protein [Candidatus Omnitrophota bacterium]